MAVVYIHLNNIYIVMKEHIIIYKAVTAIHLTYTHQTQKNKNLPWDQHPHFHLFHQVGLADPKKI